MFHITGGSGNYFTLGHGETLTIKGLPIGTTFKITESRDGIPEYTVSNTVTEGNGEPKPTKDSDSVPTGIPRSNFILLMLIGLGEASMAVLFAEAQMQICK